MRATKILSFVLFLMSGSTLGAAPPVFSTMGQPGVLSDRVTVCEGEELDLLIEVADPDGDEIVLQAENLPNWLSFDPLSRRLRGVAPYWSEDSEERDAQPGTFDISFLAEDGLFSVEKIISVEILDADWEELSLAELVEARPLQVPSRPHTPVELQHTSEEIIHSDFGGGVDLRKVCFAFRSQTPAVEGWEDDWVSRMNCAYLPTGSPAAEGAGAVVEGAYSRDFGERELAERAAAELGIPVLIIDRDWDWGYPSDLMGPYDQKASEEGDPAYLFYLFSSSHYIRAGDALITVIRQYTDWDVDYDTFRLAFTGLSKLGHTAFLSAGIDPDRVVGFLSAGAIGFDGNSGRLLGRVQGATGISPEAHVGYLGTMMRSYVLDRYAQEAADPDTVAVFTLGTDDNKGDPSDYTPKYGLLMGSMMLALPNCLGSMPNAPHTTQTPIVSEMWRMLLAHLFLGRPLSGIESLHQQRLDAGLQITAKISDVTIPEAVKIWYTSGNDLDTSHWNEFEAADMSGSEGVFRATIPATSTAYFVQLLDSADGVDGILTSAPEPVDRNYPLLPIAPDDVGSFSAINTSRGIRLQWNNPSSDDLEGVLIVAKEGEVPADPLDGRVVYDGTQNEYVDLQPAPSSGTVYYRAFTYDIQGHYSSGVSCNAPGFKARLPEGRSS